MKLNVQIRSATGKEVKKLRKEGQLPCIVYGKALETPVLLQCLKNDFIKVYRSAGYSTPIELSGGIEQLVLLQEIQLDPVSDEVLTVDFLAVNKNEKVSASIPIILSGESIVEKQNEGNVQLVKDTVEVEAFPQDLPHSIEVDITKIESTNDVIFVKDLKLSDKVKILDDNEQPIVTVVQVFDEEEIESTTDEKETSGETTNENKESTTE